MNFFVATYLLSSVAMGAPKPATQLPALLKEVEALYAKAGTLSADFTQINEIASLQVKKPSSGVIRAKRPDKIRWETHKPDMNVLVSDGHTFWFYTPPMDEGDRGQVIERKSSQIQSKLANALLSASFSGGPVTRTMKIQQTGPGAFTLTPKKGTAGTVLEAKVEVDEQKKIIKKVVLSHQDGNRTEILLTNIELGKPMRDEDFVFTPPPNTDRVK